mmetsp:Transcript_19589/g.59297  ORF Transcript_19589/g.59297 Transcript_19589/m.59297 type:complete len:216 (+) Transcript_19589:917-1564(+)
MTVCPKMLRQPTHGVRCLWSCTSHAQLFLCSTRTMGNAPKWMISSLTTCLIVECIGALCHFVGVDHVPGRIHPLRARQQREMGSSPLELMLSRPESMSGAALQCPSLMTTIVLTVKTLKRPIVPNPRPMTSAVALILHRPKEFVQNRWCTMAAAKWRRRCHPVWAAMTQGVMSLAASVRVRFLLELARRGAGSFFGPPTRIVLPSPTRLAIALLM